jgi:DNA-binding NarL/FixJ family response regulator
VVVIDAEGVSAAMRRYFEVRGGFAIVAASAAVEDAAGLIGGHAAEVALIDPPVLPCGEVVRGLRGACPGVRLVLWAAPARFSLFDPLAVDADGYLTKDEQPAAIAEHLTRIVAGEVVFSRSAAHFAARNLSTTCDGAAGAPAADR